jgi:hypothetical protein
MKMSRPISNKSKQGATLAEALVSIDTQVFDLTDKGDRKHLDTLLQLGEYDEPRHIR